MKGNELLYYVNKIVSMNPFKIFSLTHKITISDVVCVAGGVECVCVAGSVCVWWGGTKCRGRLALWL